MKPSRPFLVACPACGRSFGTMRGFSGHVVRAHSDDEVRLRIRAFADRSAGPDACHPWRGHLTAKGYAIITIDRYPVRVGRWLLGLGVGDPLQALHSCDNPPCVNGAHLRRGTSADNGADMVARGRSLTGERNPGGGKLTRELVVEIRAALLTDEPKARIGARFGVHGSMVTRIERGLAWRR